MIPLRHIDILVWQQNLKLAKDDKGVSTVLDPVRRKYVRATPEEIVRQLWIQYFIEVHSIHPKRIAAERAFTIQGGSRRFDLVIFDASAHPILLAEFKAPDQVIGQNVFDQIARYNMQLQIPLALISNGRDHYCFKIDDDLKAFVFKSEIPL